MLNTSLPLSLWLLGSINHEIIELFRESHKLNDEEELNIYSTKLIKVNFSNDQINVQTNINNDSTKQKICRPPDNTILLVYIYSYK